MCNLSKLHSICPRCIQMCGDVVKQSMWAMYVPHMHGHRHTHTHTVMIAHTMLQVMCEMCVPQTDAHRHTQTWLIKPRYTHSWRSFCSYLTHERVTALSSRFSGVCTYGAWKGYQAGLDFKTRPLQSKKHISTSDTDIHQKNAMSCGLIWRMSESEQPQDVFWAYAHIGCAGFLSYAHIVPGKAVRQVWV